MFWPDVIDLKIFYRTPLGRVAEDAIARTIGRLWQDSTEGEVLLGIGFPQPYLEPFRHEAERVIALMPAAQGALHWPVDGGKNLTFLADEADIPLPDESVSRVLLVHAVENTEQLRHMLREIWRVLAPNGRVLVVVPNRRGMWARMPVSPFAHGSPFSASQLRDVLKNHCFTPYAAHYTLFTPPGRYRWLLKSSRLCEWLGRRFFPLFSGLIVMEAEKQIYAPAAQKTTRKRREQGYAPATQPALTCDNH